jgi:hypothetical protein
MALDLDKVRRAMDRADGLTKRFDGFVARRAKRDADKAKRRADRDFETRRDAIPDPAEAALKASTPNASLTVDPNTVPQHPWYDSELLASERREELRQGDLSKERI